MNKNFFPIDYRWSIIVAMAWGYSLGCSSQDEYKKELPPVSKDVKFTPSESLKVIPLGVRKE